MQQVPPLEFTLVINYLTYYQPCFTCYFHKKLAQFSNFTCGILPRKEITKTKLNFDVEVCPCCKTGRMIRVHSFQAHAPPDIINNKPRNKNQTFCWQKICAEWNSIGSEWKMCSTSFVKHTCQLKLKGLKWTKRSILIFSRKKYSFFYL